MTDKLSPSKLIIDGEYVILPNESAYELQVQLTAALAECATLAANNNQLLEEIATSHCSKRQEESCTMYADVVKLREENVALTQSACDFAADAAGSLQEVDKITAERDALREVIDMDKVMVRNVSVAELLAAVDKLYKYLGKNNQVTNHWDDKLLQAAAKVRGLIQ